MKILVLDEETMSQDFLMVVKKFMLELSTNWAVSKRASKQKLEFYETIKEFRRFFKLSELSQPGSTHSNAFFTATLQGPSESPTRSDIL